MTNTLPELRFDSKPENIAVVERLIDQLSEQHSIIPEHYGNVLIAMMRASTTPSCTATNSIPTSRSLWFVLWTTKTWCSAFQTKALGLTSTTSPTPLPRKTSKSRMAEGVFLTRPGRRMCFRRRRPHCRADVSKRPRLSPWSCSWMATSPAPCVIGAPSRLGCATSHPPRIQLGDLSIVSFSDEGLLEYNRKYLDHDTYTDIITFDHSEGQTLSGRLVDLPSSSFENADNQVLRVVELQGHGPRPASPCRIQRQNP